jgi:aryl-alcohol dehydrogenase-like predicted oxidoreductase
MRYRKLGRTGLEVSEIGMGLWEIGGESMGQVNDEVSLAAMRRAWELGVNFLDTADVYGYGRSERILGRFLKEVPRDEVFIATKVGLWRSGDRSPNAYTQVDMIIEDCEASLKRLEVDYIDVYQNHLRWDENWEVFAEALIRLKQAGKARLVGLSTNDLDYVRRFDHVTGGLDTLQLDYNLLDRTPEAQLLPYCLERGIGVIVRTPLARGKLTGKFGRSTTFPEADVRRKWLTEANRPGFLRDIELVERLRFLEQGRTMGQAALAYVLAHPATSTAIPGAKTPQQVEQNVLAVERKLSASEMAHLLEVLAET